MKQDYTRLVETMRDARRNMVAAETAYEQMQDRHRDELRAASQANSKAMERVYLLEETLRLVVDEDMTVEQAKMIAHEKLAEGELIWSRKEALVVARK